MTTKNANCCVKIMANNKAKMMPKYRHLVQHPDEDLVVMMSNQKLQKTVKNCKLKHGYFSNIICFIYHFAIIAEHNNGYFRYTNLGCITIQN